MSTPSPIRGRKGRDETLRRTLRLFARIGKARYVPPIADLAVEFGVTTRTIRRDLESLEAVGILTGKWRDGREDLA